MDDLWVPSFGRAVSIYLFLLFFILLMRLCSIRFLLQRDVREVTRSPSQAKWNEISRRRLRLRGKIDRLTLKAEEYLGRDLVRQVLRVDKGVSQHLNSTAKKQKKKDDGSDCAGINTSADEDSDDESDNDFNVLDPENELIVLPSSIPLALRTPDFLPSLLEKEYKLRIGQANDALDDVRQAIGRLSWQYKNDIRGAKKSGFLKTRAWGRVHTTTGSLTMARQIYNSARAAIISVKGAEELIDPYYQPLTQDQCQTSTIITDVNARGTSGHQLSWFWRAHHNSPDEDISRDLLEEQNIGAEHDSHLTECEGPP